MMDPTFDKEGGAVSTVVLWREGLIRYLPVVNNSKVW